MSDSLVTRILNARVYDVARETALERAPRLSARLGNRIWLKREDLQSIFSKIFSRSSLSSCAARTTRSRFFRRSVQPAA